MHRSILKTTATNIANTENSPPFFIPNPANTNDNNVMKVKKK
ncbi:hypothetical protein [Solitalea agri]|nr:hypothetical protein [Solitalea agri]